MPQNCSADVQAVIAHIDEVFAYGTDDEIYTVKANFGMQDVTHLDDVVGYRKLPATAVRMVSSADAHYRSS